MSNISKLYNFFYTGGQGVLDAIAEVFDHVFFRIYLMINIGLNALLWFIASYLKSNVHKDLAILHYNVDFGVDLIGSTDEFFTIPVMSLLIIITNILITVIMAGSRHFRVLAHILMSAGIIINIVLLVAFASIYLINFR